MNLKKIAIVIACITVMLSLGVGMMAEDIRDGENGIYRGISLFGPYGEGHAAFVPHNEIYAGEIHVLGWGGIEIEEGVYDWSLIDDYLKYYEANNKRAAIRIQSAGHSTWETPRWLYDNYGVRQITGQGVFFDFSQNESLEQKSMKEFVAGRNEYVTTVTGGTKKDGVLMSDIAGETVIESTNHLFGYDTQIGFDYKGTGKISVIISTDGEDKVFKSFEGKEDWQSAMFLIPKLEFNFEPTIKFVVDRSEIALDNVSISAKADGIHNFDTNLSFPNYFDPIYIEKYSNFVRAFAEQYIDNPNVGAVVVGGFGRWDELSMLGEHRSEFDLHTKQWRAYGYYDNLYIDHVEKMCQLFEEEFGDSKEVILHIAAFSLPSTGLGDGAGDANYVGYAVNNLAKKYGFIAKLNGLTEKMSEWGQAQNGFNYFANRYKYNTETKHILETALQVNNPRGYWTGHPISLYNRVMIDQVDNIWHYSVDIKLPFVMKHAHTFNEQAGNALFTRSYNIFMRTYFRADATNWDGSADDQVFRNLWNGLYLMNERGPGSDSGNDEHKNNYGYILDREVLKTSESYPAIRLSLDDRQSFNVLYGSVFAVEYYDTGNDTFTVFLSGESGQLELGTVTKTNSGEFKTAYFYAGDFFDTKNNGDKVDILYEVIIDDNSDGEEFINMIELNSVPSIDWKKEKVYEPSFSGEKEIKRISRGEDPVKFEIIKQGPVSSVEINIGTDLKDYSVLGARIYGIKSGEKTLITEKEHYMPGQDDILRLPVAKADYFTEKFEVEFFALRGSGYVFLDNSGEFAYSLNKYVGSEGPEVSLINQSQRISAIYPFYGIKVSSKGDSDITVQKNLVDEWVDVANVKVTAGDDLVTFEPQIAGQYRIVQTGGSKADITLMYLERRSDPNPSSRYNKGTDINADFKKAFESDKYLWAPSKGFVNIKSEKGIWTGEILEPNAWIQTNTELAIVPNDSQIFHFIIKNETSSDMVKIYWMNEGDTGYSEEKVAYVPIVPNDREFREYSWPIGEEASRYFYMGMMGSAANRSTFTYADDEKGKITGFKVVPASGLTVSSGKISIATMDLRENDTINYTFKEALDIDEIVKNEKMISINVERSFDDYKNIILGAILLVAVLISGGLVLFISKRGKKR